MTQSRTQKTENDIQISEVSQRDGRYNIFRLSIVKDDDLKSTAVLVGEELDGKRKFHVLIRMYENHPQLVFIQPDGTKFRAQVRVKEWWE